MTPQFFWNLSPGDQFRSLARGKDIFIKRSLTSAELIAGSMRVLYYFAADAEVVLLSAPPEPE